MLFSHIFEIQWSSFIKKTTEKKSFVIRGRAYSWDYEATTNFPTEVTEHLDMNMTGMISKQNKFRYLRW